MTCGVCGRTPVFHGSELRNSESGCQSGVWMDDDVYAEGYQPDVHYPPCPYNPLRCASCNGTGDPADAEAAQTDDCPACGGNGWAGGQYHAPHDRYALPRRTTGEDR